jgi:bacterial leucyl aminopeptidase
MANFDVVGYPSRESIGIFTDYTNAALNAFLRLVVDEYCAWGWSNQACGYGCSGIEPVLQSGNMQIPR